MVLLAGSLFFYWMMAGANTLWLLLAAALTWVLGLWLGRLQELQAAAAPGLAPAARKAAKHQFTTLQKSMIAAGVTGLLGLLLWLKYLPFLVKTLNALLAQLPFGVQASVPSFVQPVGLSFFTLMAMSYLFDVRRGTAKPAAHYWQVLLYLSFWPHVVEGPFDRWGQISPALLAPPKPDYRAFTFGVQRILWGMMKKLIIADRANMYVKAVFDDWTNLPAPPWWWAPCCTPCSCTRNFPAAWTWSWARRSVSACLWRKTSASLSLPAASASSGAAGTSPWAPGCENICFSPSSSANPCSLRQMVPHSVWGGPGPQPAGLGGTAAHLAGYRPVARRGLAVCAVRPVLFPAPMAGGGSRTHPAAPLSRPAPAAYPALVQIVPGGPHLCAGKLRHAAVPANGTRAALDMLASLTRPYQGSLLIKLDAKDLWVLVVGAVVLLAVDLLHERGVAIRQTLARQPLPLRWAVYCGGMLAVMIFGAYGDNYDPAAFIYAQF